MCKINKSTHICILYIIWSFILSLLILFILSLLIFTCFDIYLFWYLLALELFYTISELPSFYISINCVLFSEYKTFKWFLKHLESASAIFKECYAFINCNLWFDLILINLRILFSVVFGSDRCKKIRSISWSKAN